MLSFMQRKLTGLSDAHVTDSAHEGFFSSMQVAVLDTALFAREAFVTYVTSIPSNAQMRCFDVTLEVKLGVVDLVAVLSHAAVHLYHELFHNEIIMESTLAFVDHANCRTGIFISDC